MINVSEWKEFNVGKLLNPKTTKLSIKSELDKGNIPFISRTGLNNGVDDYVDVESDKVTLGDCITIGAEGLFAFYQANDFATGNKVYTLRNPDMNKKSALFICTILNLEVFKYSYGRARVLNKLQEEIIKLPAKLDENNNFIIDGNKKYSDEGYIPDWKYMEEFIERLETRERESQGSIRDALKTENKVEKVPELNINDWKDFIIGKLFKIKRGKRLIEEDRESGDIFYFSASQDNNGLTDKIANPLFIESDSLIYSTFGDCYYVEGEFTASDEISILQNDNLNKNIGLFIATIINKNKYKYAYGRKAFRNKFVNESIKLPIKKDENNRYLIDNYKEYSDKGYIPDWSFMENYIKALPYGDKI